MSYERKRKRNPNYDPRQAENGDVGTTKSSQAPTYSMQRTMDGRKRPQLKTDAMPQRIVGPTYVNLPFQLFPKLTKTSSTTNIHDLGSMHKDIDTALKQSSDAFTIAKAAWNNQLAYFKTSFTEIDKRQRALSESFRILAANLTLNSRKLKTDQQNIEDNSSAWKVVGLAKAIISAIKRIVITFTQLSTDETRIKTESKNLANSFKSLASNVGKLKKIF